MHTLDGVLQLATAMRNDPAKIDASPKTLAFLEFIIKEKEAARGQAMADWNMTAGVIQSFQLCLQALVFRQRGVYIPECDPYYVPSSSSGASTP